MQFITYNPKKITSTIGAEEEQNITSTIAGEEQNITSMRGEEEQNITSTMGGEEHKFPLIILVIKLTINK